MPLFLSIVFDVRKRRFAGGHGMNSQGVDQVQAVNRWTVLCVVLAGLASMGVSGQGADFWLITPEEAAAPGVPANNVGLSDQAISQGSEPLEVGREVDTGPIIEVLKPASNKVEVVPVEVWVQFAARSAPVDISSLKVQVVKLVLIDITDRVRPYTDVQGIHIPDAKLPSGEHKVRISLADREGGLTRKEMVVTVP